MFVNPRRLSHLRQNRSRGVTSRSVGEKNKESHRDSHKKDMSPLTQGLNYRSACDVHYTLQCESKKSPLRFSYIFFPNGGNFSPNYTRLLYVPIHARPQIFI